MIRTKLTEMLGIEYPIVQGCMQWISRAPLFAAVSEAGGLGLLSSSTFSSADELQAEIRKIKSMTSKPFAVNLTLMPASLMARTMSSFGGRPAVSMTLTPSSAQTRM